MTSAQALTLIERTVASDEESGDETRWDQPFCEACDLLVTEVKVMPAAQLARLLRWLDDNDCYYHAEICELKGAALKEAADRLEAHP